MLLALAMTALHAQQTLDLKWKNLDRGAQYCVFEGEIFGQPQCVSILRYSEDAFTTDLVNDSADKAATPSVFGTRYGAVAAINAGYFNMKTLYPTTYAKENGRQEGWTRPSELFRVEGQVLMDGAPLSIVPCDTLSGPELAQTHNDALASGPMLVKDGAIVVHPCRPSFDEENPRSIIGIGNDGLVYLVVVDGRFHGKAEGTTIQQTAELCVMLGLRDAINLDGGGSSALWIRPEGVISHPYDNHKYDNAGERTVPNAIIVSYARQKHTVRYRGAEREYYISLPENAGPDTPLVFCLHGYGGKAGKYRPEMELECLRRGYAICYPQGLKAPIGKTGWYVRYPKQEGMKDNDVDFMLYLAKTLPREFGLSRENVFFSGMSNGGEMCYIMAYKHPEAFRAIASVAGLQMGWTLRELKPRGAVPFMEIHGTGDMTSRWSGDPDNSYGWGEYLAVPSAVANIVSMNGCREYSKVELPLLSDKSRQVILHRYTRGRNDSEVLLYEVVGGPHSWALSDMDTPAAILDFFDRYRR